MASRALVALALRRGATDNLSAVVLRYRAGDTPPARRLIGRGATLH